MNIHHHRTAGWSLVSIIVATVVLGITAVGLVQYANTVAQHRRELDIKVQEDSYRVFQNEIALSGSNPIGMTVNPLGGAQTEHSPAPIIFKVADPNASRSLPGSATVDAYAARSDMDGRSGSMGYRIVASGPALPPPGTTPLLAPTFRVSGVVPESEFTPDLTSLILGNPANPPGTVYRYTTDGTNPTASSPLWTVASSLPRDPLPDTIKAAAFHSDPQYTTSPIVSDALSRALTIAYTRGLGGNSTGFTYPEVTGGTNGIVLNVSNAPSGTAIYFTVDGSVPTTSSAMYGGEFQVPLGEWGPVVTLRAIAVTGTINVTVTPLTVALSPMKVPLPSPSFGAVGGTLSNVLIPVTSTVAGAIIRYDIDTLITGTSPTIPSGADIAVTAP
jgi:hypothetical protein